MRSQMRAVARLVATSQPKHHSFSTYVSGRKRAILDASRRGKHGGSYCKQETASIPPISPLLAWPLPVHTTVCIASGHPHHGPSSLSAEKEATASGLIGSPPSFCFWLVCVALFLPGFHARLKPDVPHDAQANLSPG